MNEPLRSTVSIDPDICSGQATLPGTRFPVKQLIAELGDGEKSLHDICDNFGLNKTAAKEFMHALAIEIECMT